MNSDDQYPFVSVIIPAYNEEAYIESCLASVLAQDWPLGRMEILVVNNGSNDATQRLAENMLATDGRGRVLNVYGGTIAAVRNYGWRHAKGELLAFLDGDSVVEPKWLKTALSIFNNYNGSIGVGFKMKSSKFNPSLVEKVWEEIGNSSRHKITKKVDWLCSFNIIVKNEIFSHVDGFTESLETGEDYDLGKKMSKYGNLIYSVDIEVEHCGGIKTFKELFFKELWRGLSLVDACSRARLKDIVSTIVPMVYICGVFVLAIAPIFLKFTFSSAIIIILFLVLPPAAMAMRRGLRGERLLGGTAFYFVYLFARGVAALGGKWGR